MLLGGAIRGGVDGADVGIVGFFLCVCFELDALALMAEWSSWATYLVAIASKPPRPNLGPTLIAERSVMHVGGQVRGSPSMKWAIFGVLAASTMPCVGVRRGSCDYGGRWTFSSL